MRYSNPLNPALEGRILNVPNIFPTIQEAINNAKDGDIVVVENGIYTEDGNKNISFLGKAITVISENGADLTIIDCNHSGRGFIFENEEDSLSVLDGFTITNGEVKESSGGGIYLHNSSPTMKNVIITDNKAS